MNWYKKASEYTGADATFTNGNHISDTVIRNIGNQQLPSSISNLPIGAQPESKDPKQVGRIIHDKCEKCSLKLEPFEKLNYCFTNENKKEEEAYWCRNCGYKNHYNGAISKKKIKRKRRAGVSTNIIKKASPPLTTYNNWASSYNPANTPMGRLDLSQDERVIPWESIKDSFSAEWNSQRQKGNDEKDYKTIIKKDKNGKLIYVRIKKKTTGGEAIQPSNTYTKKGRVKKQRRYNEDGKDKKNDNPGAGPHNRNQSGGGDGWYQAPSNQNFDSDYRQRMTSWYEHLNSRGTQNLSRPY